MISLNGRQQFRIMGARISKELSILWSYMNAALKKIKKSKVGKGE